MLVVSTSKKGVLMSFKKDNATSELFAFQEEMKKTENFTELDKLLTIRKKTDSDADDRTTAELLEKIWFPNGLPSLHKLNANIFDLEIQSLITSPFGAETSGDALSRIYKKLLQRTPSPPALTLFNLIFYASSALVAKGSRIHRPKAHKHVYADLWTMLLAPTGAMKTLTHGVLVDALPTHIKSLFVGAENIVIPEPQSNAALIDSLYKAHITENGESVGVVMIDEAGQLIKEIENINSNKRELKKTLLTTKDNAAISTNTKTGGTTTIDKPVLALRFINTIEQMATAISEESFTDGFMRRFNVVIAELEKNQQGKLFPTFDLDYKNTKLPEDLAELYSGQVEDDYYFCDEASEHFDATYRIYFPIFREKFTGSKDDKNIKWNAFIHTYFQEAWKYAVIHHYFYTKKKNQKVKIESLDWAFKVVFYSLNSFHRFLNEYVSKPKVQKTLQSELKRAEKVKTWLNENRDLKNLAKECQRKFAIKADALFSVITEIEQEDDTWLNPIEAWTKKKKTELKRLNEEAL